jgi:hypothetical protein
MLKMDGDTSHIRVVITMIRREETELDDIIAEMNQEVTSRVLAVQMN